MPELPEVAALAEALSDRTRGLTVARIDVAAVSVLKTFDPPVAAAADAAVLGFSRYGKHLVLDLADVAGEPLHLVLHLARAGWVRWRDEAPAAPPTIGGRSGGRGTGSSLALRISFRTRDGQRAGAIDVTEAGTQKRLAAHIVRDPRDVEGIAALGPDPLDAQFDAAAFHDVLARAGRAQIKGVLRDQSRIAGIGNAYSDEILHAARMSPFASAATLSPDTEARLYRAIRSTLAAAVAAARATDPALLKAEKRAGMAVHGRTGQPCGVCGDVIREVSFADSSLQYCPTCQTGGRPLADRRMSRLLK
ncbi:MAG: DNA-formamidopyrimidine glycosylase family protein [Candidatus Nanopelagicales bacterium]